MDKTEVFRNLIAYLDKNNCSYELHEHEPYDTTYENAEQITGVSLSIAAKSLLYKVTDGYVLVVLPLFERVSSGKLRRAIGEKNVRLATPDELYEVMSCLPGTCHPVGSLVGVRTIADVTLADMTEFSLGTGEARCTIVMPYEAYEHIVRPEVLDVHSETNNG
jgi:prolyl-tRNA editing enzyme YbaK/EbsC (Cys-tRNA(Pro) deacylase)